jgi:hypothetical protein
MQVLFSELSDQLLDDTFPLHLRHNLLSRRELQMSQYHIAIQ